MGPWGYPVSHSTVSNSFPESLLGSNSLSFVSYFLFALPYTVFLESQLPTTMESQ